MSQEKRMDNIEKSLTPKQAVILWLEEIRDIQSVEEYIQFVRSKPESYAPITRLTGQVGRAVEQAMRGCDKKLVQQARHRAVRDVVFLEKLRLQVNFKVLTERKAWSLTNRRPRWPASGVFRCTPPDWLSSGRRNPTT